MLRHMPSHSYTDGQKNLMPFLIPLTSQRSLRTLHSQRINSNTVFLQWNFSRQSSTINQLKLDEDSYARFNIKMIRRSIAFARGQTLAASDKPGQSFQV